jgi:hypothetical protein
LEPQHPGVSQSENAGQPVRTKPTRLGFGCHPTGTLKPKKTNPFSENPLTEIDI